MVYSPNSFYFYVLTELLKMGLPVKVSTGGKTKFNRSRLNAPKTRALDVACTGNTPESQPWKIPVLAIKAGGRGSYQRTNLDSFEFPRGCLIQQNKAKGFRSETLSVQSYPREKRMGNISAECRLRTRFIQYSN
jgi:hypothetical protein